MKLRTISLGTGGALATGATLALVASAAVAASAKTLPNHVVAKHVTTVKHLTPASVRTATTPHVIYTAPFGSTPITTPIYLYIPGSSAPDPNVPTAPVDCTQSPDACTTDQLCDIWGEC